MWSSERGSSCAIPRRRPGADERLTKVKCAGEPPMQGFDQPRRGPDESAPTDVAAPFQGGTMSAAQLRILFPATCASALASRLGKRYRSGIRTDFAEVKRSRGGQGSGS